uniref:Uncharacterized protein n=1 Tax=Aplanochytrium stocchinoi TaxID=215587 RepID=A0A7S3V2R2_9STRA
MDIEADTSTAADHLNNIENTTALAENQDSNICTSSYQKGRFLVVKSDNIETDTAAPAVHLNNIETTTASAENQDANTNTNSYQQGRFLVVKNDNIEGDTPSLADHLNNIETTTVSAESQDENINTNTYQQGRFFVMKNDNIEMDTPADAPKTVALDSQNKNTSLKKVTSAASMGTNQTGGVRRFFVAEPERRKSTTTKAEQQVFQHTDLNAPLPPVTAKISGQPQQKTLASELQRISNQNHKLHNMLRTLLKAQGLEVPAGSGNKAIAGTSSDDTKKQRSLGNISNMGGSSNSVGSTTGGGSLLAPKQHIAAAVDPHRLQEICSELNSGSKNLIMEYNALKSKNHVLTKQLLDTKAQLKEMTLNYENLKSQLAAHKQKT